MHRSRFAWIIFNLQNRVTLALQVTKLQKYSLRAWYNKFGLHFIWIHQSIGTSKSMYIFEEVAVIIFLKTVIIASTNNFRLLLNLCSANVQISETEKYSNLNNTFAY